MKERKEVVSKNLENVLPTLGTNSKKPNCLVLAVDDDIVLEAMSLYKDKKKGIERESGLIRIEAVFVYAEEEVIDTRDAIDMENNVSIEEKVDSTEQKIQDMSDELDGVLDEGGEG